MSKVNHFLLFWILLTVALYYGRPVLIPLTFAIMLAMLMAPVCRWFDEQGWKRVFSVIGCIFILILVFAGVLWIIAAQISSFAGEIPKMESRLQGLAQSLMSSVEKNFDVPKDQQQQILQEKTGNLQDSSLTYIRRFLRSIGSLIAGLAITLAFTFLLLFHKEKYEKFFLKIGSFGNQEEKQDLLNGITKVAQQYLTGRAISMAALFVLYVIALMVIGVKNALLLSAIAALVNIIPYIGPILAGVFPFIMALTGSDSFTPAIWVVISFSVIQGIDNYFITPYTLGGEVRLSALATILAIISGGFVWGVAGMILFIPMLSIAKIVFDHIPTLKPYGFLIGDPGESPTTKFKKWLSRIRGGK